MLTGNAVPPPSATVPKEIFSFTINKPGAKTCTSIVEIFTAASASTVTASFPYCTFAGPKRIVKPGINFTDLPKIDIIVVSHNHYDHLDIRTIKDLWIRDKPKIITPLMNDVIIKKHIPNAEIITLGWGESYKEQEIQLNLDRFRQDEFKGKPEERTEVREQRLDSKNSLVSSFLNEAVEFYLEPAQHWSARGIFNKNKALWGTFIIKTKIGDICFIGDSGYNDTLFKEIGKKHNILISLIPIGAYEPRWFMKPVHMNPEEAVFTLIWP
ncbi:MAG TPA: palindromic element RPE3 domain-containing protein [Rickettsia endosymbiont of Ceroptres masudai]|nr:palindromic element RPE3 domain-containing protein [Rickettsia endosymbiont of Ceroptres masudai]